MKYGQSSLHGRGLDSSSELRDPVYFENRSQQTTYECEGRLSELLIDSATDESEANSPIKMTPQENKEEVLYLWRTRKGTMRSKMMIERINESKMKLGKNKSGFRNLDKSCQLSRKKTRRGSHGHGTG